VRGNLSPRYIGLYEIIEKLNPVVYRQDLPIDLGHVHNVFHVCQLGKYVPDPYHAIIAEPIEITKDLPYEERLDQIVNRMIK